MTQKNFQRYDKSTIVAIELR